MKAVPDSKCGRKTKHDHAEVLVCLVIGFLVGRITIRRSLKWCERHLEWLRKYIPLKNGIELTMEQITVSLFPYVLLYFGYAILSILPGMLSFEIKFLESLFILAGGYAAQHMIFTLMKITLYVLNIHYDPGGNLIHLFITRYLVFVIGAGIIYYLIIRRKQKKTDFRMEM